MMISLPSVSGVCSKTANPPAKPEPNRQPSIPNNQRVVMSLEQMLEVSVFLGIALRLQESQSADQEPHVK